MFKMYQQWLSSLLFTSAQLLTLTAAAPQFDPSLPSAGPNAGFNPRSVEALASRDYFYVGGKYVKADPPANGTIMVGQIYVEHLQPCEVRQKYPLVLWHGAAQTGTNWLNTPDGRKGWASYFLEQGYELYIVDQPQRGRSPWEIDQGSVAYFSADELESTFTAPEKYDLYPLSVFHNQWPGNGTMGDPIFDTFYGSQVQYQANVSMSEANNRNAGSALFNRIGPAVLLTHSQAGSYGWGLGNDNSDNVKAIFAIEPEGPPFENVLVQGSGPARPYGIATNPLTYDPPVTVPSRDLVQQKFPPAAINLTECVRQVEPAKKLVNLAKIPITIMSSQASYHTAYDYCTVAYLQQAGVNAQYLNLTAAGILGNGHFMFIEKNNMQIAPLVDTFFRTIK